VPVSAVEVVAAADAIVEIAVPWQTLRKAPDAPLAMFAELLRDGQVIERIPREGVIETTVPSPDYELMMWQA
jgi:hypothetical protein